MFIKKALRSLFWLALKALEAGNESYEHKPSHRVILVVMGFIFLLLGSLVLYFSQGEEIAYFIPVVVFGGVGILSTLVGFIGSDRAVSKIWGLSR